MGDVMDLHQTDWEKIPWKPVREGITRKAFSGNGAALGLLQIPPDVMHWGEIVGDEPVLNLDIFTPVREEYAPAPPVLTVASTTIGG